MQEIITNKICIKCNIDKNISEFYFRKDSGKYKNECIECSYSRVQEYNTKNKELIAIRSKKYREDNREILRLNKMKYYRENIDKIKIKDKEYAYKNKEKIAKYQKEYDDANKEAKRLYDIEYRKNHPKNQERASINQIARRKTKEGRALMINYLHNRRLKLRDGDVTADEIISLQDNAKKCYWCSEKLIKNNIHIDHYIPIAKGGKHTISNLVVSCAKCNQSKNAKDPIEFANKLGKLL